ncbi:mitochondrial 54S ribosomal protein L40 [Solimonas fluminis]|uniref:mitochondrial 54S ribosomal protein L40 n=1 Tax=Solimonas fluminis TaxID=2086571 RepID=UPI000DF3C4EB|nr:mitochondrial 54S ribosomal protein L40 [Solimonas fluminis]
MSQAPSLLPGDTARIRHGRLKHRLAEILQVDGRHATVITSSGEVSLPLSCLEAE